MSAPTWVLCGACGLYRRLPDPANTRIVDTDLKCPRCGCTTASVEEQYPEREEPEK